MSVVPAEAMVEDLRAFGVAGQVARAIVAIWRTAVLAFLSDDTIANDEAKHAQDEADALQTRVEGRIRPV